MKTLFSSPHFVNAPNKNRVARLLNTAVWSILIVTTVYAVGLNLIGQPIDTKSLILMLTPLPLGVIILLLLRKGHIHLSSTLFVWSIWGVMAGATLIAGGVYAPAYGGMLIPIMLSGVVLNRRDTIWLAIVSAIVGYALITADANGWLTQVVFNSDRSILISHILFFIIAAVFAYLASENRERMLDSAQENESLALEANKRLEAEIAERQRAEKELRFQAYILDQVSDAIIAVDSDLRIRYWNQGAEKLYGLTSQYVLRKRLMDVLDPGLDTNHQELLRKSLIQKGYWQGQDRTIVRETGREVVTESRMRLIVDENNTLNTIISVRDIRLRVETEEALAYKTELQKLLTEMAVRFLNLTTENMDQGINEALSILCKFSQVDRGAIVLFSNDLSTMSIAYEYCGPCIPSLLETQQNIGTAHNSWLMEKLRRAEIVSITDANNLPLTAQRMQDIMRKAQVKSIINVPLMRNDKLWGFIAYSTLYEEKIWSDDLIDQLLILGQLIVNIFDRRQFEENLHEQAKELDKLAGSLTMIHNLDQAIFSSRSLEEITQLALTSLQELTKCKCNSVFLISDDGTGYFLAQHPPTSEPVVGERVLLDSIDYLDELRDGIILLKHNLRAQPSTSSGYKMAIQMDVDAAVHVPLMVRSTLIGILHLGFAKPEIMDDINIDAVESVASSLSLAIANTQLYKQVQSNATELGKKVAERTAKLERQYHLQSALAEIELAINHPAELEGVLHQIVAVTAETLPADVGVSVILWDPDEGTYYTSATSILGLEPGQSARRARKQGGSTRWIIDNGKPLVIPDVRESSFDTNSLLLEYGIGSYAGVPLSIEGKTIGVLYALLSGIDVFNQDDVDFLVTVASRAAVAVTKVRLFEQAQVIAAEEERKRIARELHDGVSQSLFSASVIAQSLPRLLDHDTEMVRSGLEDLHQLTIGTLAEMRILLFELRPNSLAETDLGELLSQLTMTFTTRAGVPVSLSVDADLDLPPSQHIGLYRITQEALNNISRHAKAKHVTVELHNDQYGYILKVCDDGIGFDQQKIPSGHLGIQIMHERATDMNAALLIDSSLGAGTSIQLTRPYLDTTKNARSPQR